jgi:ribonuclease HI
MKHVDIFITHNMTSLKARRAAYVYVIYALTSKGDATCSEFGMEQNVTVNRINLYAFCSALAHFTSPAEITVYTDSSVLASAFNCGNIDKWQKNGFQTARGRPLANADLWCRVAPLIGERCADETTSVYKLGRNRASKKIWLCTVSTGIKSLLEYLKGILYITEP